MPLGRPAGHPQRRTAAGAEVGRQTPATVELDLQVLCGRRSCRRAAAATSCGQSARRPAAHSACGRRPRPGRAAPRSVGQVQHPERRPRHPVRLLARGTATWQTRQFAVKAGVRCPAGQCTASTVSWVCSRSSSNSGSGTGIGGPAVARSAHGVGPGRGSWSCSLRRAAVARRSVERPVRSASPPPTGASRLCVVRDRRQTRSGGAAGRSRRGHAATGWSRGCRRSGWERPAPCGLQARLQGSRARAAETTRRGTAGAAARWRWPTTGRGSAVPPASLVISPAPRVISRLRAGQVDQHQRALGRRSARPQPRARARRPEPRGEQVPEVCQVRPRRGRYVEQQPPAARAEEHAAPAAYHTSVYRVAPIRACRALPGGPFWSREPAVHPGLNLFGSARYMPQARLGQTNEGVHLVPFWR